MAQRPPLSDASFLAAVFSPKKNPVPTGLRKRKIVSTTKRKAARVKAFNSMTPLNQRVLDETGKREAYLRGEITITDAKRSLREKAVSLGVAKPLRPKGTAKTVSGVRPTDTRTKVLDHLWTQLTGTDTRRPVNIKALRLGTRLMTPDQLSRALQMGAPEIKAAAANPDERVEVEGKILNPFFYH